MIAVAPGAFMSVFYPPFSLFPACLSACFLPAFRPVFYLIDQGLDCFACLRDWILGLDYLLDCLLDTGNWELGLYRIEIELDTGQGVLAIKQKDVSQRP